MQQFSSLLIPFIGIILLSLMVDKLTLVLQHIMQKVPHLPDEFEKPIAYAIVLSISFICCWRGNFSLFRYLEFSFDHDWEGWQGQQTEKKPPL